MTFNRATVKAYYWLVKPGIVYGNVMACLAGFFFASGLTHNLSFGHLLAVVIGTSFVIASACVVNNYLDRGIDERMERTSWRALVQGTISTRAALIYAVILGVSGFTLLVLGVNLLTAGVGVVGYIFYVVIYGIAKRHTPFSTLIGSVSGAVPPVAGYTAVAGQLDGAAVILFAIMTVWQMPHFYAIAIRRRREYAAAKVPVLSVVRGDEVTRRRIVGYLVAYLFIVPSLTLVGAGMIYVVASTLVAGYWLGIAISWWKQPAEVWAKKVFIASLGVLMAQSILTALAAILP